MSTNATVSTSKRQAIILGVMMVCYALIFGTISCLRHYNFQTQTWDMGVFTQTMWNSAHGRWMQNSLEEARNHLGVHMSPFLFLLVPGYAVFPSPYFLLIVQTIALALGAWPLYLLARHMLGLNQWPLIIVAGYLLSPSIHWINLFDFHEIAFFPALLLAGLYCIQRERWGWALFWLAGAASAKEDAILVILVVGVYLLVRKKVSTMNSIAASSQAKVSRFPHIFQAYGGIPWKKQSIIGSIITYIQPLSATLR